MEAPPLGPGMALGLLSTAPGEHQCPAWLRASPQLFLLGLRVKGRARDSAHPGLTSAAAPPSLRTEPALPSEPLPAHTSDETSVLAPVYRESHQNTWIMPCLFIHSHPKPSTDISSALTENHDLRHADWSSDTGSALTTCRCGRRPDPSSDTNNTEHLPRGHR